MRVTLFGASGLLGKTLMQHRTGDVTPLTSKDADIRDARQVLQAIEKTRPEWIVLTAAYTDVDGCETNRDLAFTVNRDGAENVARAAQQIGCRLLTLSTDYVFDGTNSVPYETTDPRVPRSVYGRSKAEGEIRVQEVLPHACIVRTSWLFGVGGKCFPDTILKLAATQPELDVVNDQQGSPTYSVDLARAIIQLCHRGAEGIIHATNSGECTWFEFAREITAEAGLSTVIRPTTSDKFVRPAERPKYSVLSPHSLNHYGITMPSWQDALHRYLAERGA